MWRGRFRGASPSKRVGRKEPCRRLARQVSDGEPSAARPHSCPRQSPTQLFITGPPTPTTTPTPPLRYIDAAFTGRRRLLDATATIFFVAREAHVRPPSLFVITTHHPLSPFNSPHHPPATFIRQPRSATTGSATLSMSVDERSPKRQRRSYSPPSPAPAAKSAFVAQHPHTPPPSVHMSPTWNAQSSSLQQGGVTFPTPPSTSGYQGHMTGRGSSSEGGIESGKGTPMESGEMHNRDGDGDVNMGGEVDAEHRRSDHERNGEGATPVVLPGLFKLPTKRKYPMHAAFVC